MKARFTAAAELELENAERYYNQQRAGLGDEFLAEVAKAVALIESHPKARPPVSPIDRACRVRRFPYHLVYFIHDDGIVVLAVAHFKRRLSYWRSRSRD